MEKRRQRVISMAGDMNLESVSNIVEKLVKMDAESTEPITLIIDTYGGSVHSMFSLYDVIKGVSSQVHTMGVGRVFSAGVTILAAGEPGYRRVGPNTRIMLHPISMNFEGSITDAESHVEEIKMVEEMYHRCLMVDSKFKAKELWKILRGSPDQPQENFFSPEECIRKGLVDSIF